MHRRLEMAVDPDFRDEGGQYQYGWVLFEEAVLDACGIDMDELRSALSTKRTGREDAGRIETSLRLLESIRDLCLMVRSKAHVKVAKKYSDILGELRTMATEIARRYHLPAVAAETHRLVLRVGVYLFNSAPTPPG